MIPAMATSQAPMTIFFTVGIVLTFVVIIGACIRGSRDRAAQRTSYGCVSIGLLAILVGVLMYGWSWFSGQLPALTHLPTTFTVHLTPAPSPGTRAYYVWYARQAAQAVNYNPDVFVKQIELESHFNPKAVGSAGEIGIAQFMPATAHAWGVTPSDPISSLDGAARLMAHLLTSFDGDYAKALAAYNAGESTVSAAIRRAGSSWQTSIPATTRRYIHLILEGVQM